jgi:hypothetical protein
MPQALRQAMHHRRRWRCHWCPKTIMQALVMLMPDLRTVRCRDTLLAAALMQVCFYSHMHTFACTQHTIHNSSIMLYVFIIYSVAGYNFVWCCINICFKYLCIRVLIHTYVHKYAYIFTHKHALSLSLSFSLTHTRT